MIPGLGRSAGEGVGYPLQYSWASLVAQRVKTWVQSLGWEDPLEKGKATYSSIPAWSILKEISPGISLEGMMLKLKLQYFGRLM